MAKSYKVSVFAGTKVVADMAQQVKNATIEASIQVKTIKGGATSATATILRPGPAGQNRKMEDVQGWFVNGTSAEPPVATGTAWEAPAGKKNTNWWNGTAWSLGSSVPLPVTPISDEVVEGGTEATSQDAVYKHVEPTIVQTHNNYIAVKQNREEVGVDNIPLLVKGGLTLQGVEVDYTSAQPRMRTGFIQLQNQKITITTTKEMFVIVFDVSKKFKYNTFDTLGWTKTVTLDKGFGYFRIVARNVGSTAIIDADLDNSFLVTRFNEVKDSRGMFSSVYGAVPYESKTEIWKNGFPDPSTEETTTSAYAIYSSYFKNTGKQITVSVNAGYKVGVRIYRSQEANTQNLIGYYNSAQSQLFQLDDSYYLRLFVIADDHSKVINPSSFPEIGLSVTGLSANYEDFIRPAKDRAQQLVQKSFDNGYYNSNKAFVPANNRKSFLYDMGSKGGFLTFDIGSAFSFDVWVWNGVVSTEATLSRKSHSLFVKSGYQVTVNIKKSNGADFDGTENLGWSFKRVDEIKERVGFINMNAKLSKHHYNADEYGLSMDNANNSPALADLVDYVNRHGGGTIILPVGVYNFQDRIPLKSYVDLIGYGGGKSILRMVGTTKRFSLFDNLDITIKNCRYRDFTVDGYDLNPADGVYSTDMKAFNFHSVVDCDFTNLVLQGTPATGLGIDYLHGVTITNNHVIECGRLWLANGAPEMQGGSGIGIGTGVFFDENFIVSHNVVEKCGQNGIFIEDQGIFSGQTTQPARGSIIDSNTVRNGKWNGIALRGNTRIKMTNNTVYSNINGGFFADKYLRECDVSGNIFINNRYGIYAIQGDTRGSYDNSFNNNLIKASTIAGIQVDGTNSRDFDFKNNSLVDNAKGIILQGNSDNFYFDGNKIRRSTSADLDMKGTHNDLVFKNTSYRGVKTNMATFTGDTSENQLI